MTDIQSPTNPSTPSPDRGPAPKSRLGFRIRVVIFVIIVLACGWYSRIFRFRLTGDGPVGCAEGNMALFFLDFNEIPVRMSDQFNSCTGISDGECSRNNGTLIIRGECRDERMHGPWSLKDAQTGAVWWSGTYCNGLPCGEFHRRLDDNHEFMFHVQNMHIHGPAKTWEMFENRLTEYSGNYDHGKRKGRWVRNVEPGPVLHSVSIYDDTGSATSTTYYCKNGLRKEVRGQKIFFFDAQGNTLRNDPADPLVCPLP